jgi:hypothetical protein
LFLGEVKKALADDRVTEQAFERQSLAETAGGALKRVEAKRGGSGHAGKSEHGELHVCGIERCRFGVLNQKEGIE